LDSFDYFVLPKSKSAYSAIGILISSQKFITMSMNIIFAMQFDLETFFVRCSINLLDLVFLINNNAFVTIDVWKSQLRK